MYTEQDFVSDIIACVHARYLGMRHGWPNYQLLGRVLDDWNCRLSVTFADLYKTGLFRNTNGVAKFVEFYAKYDFCEPPRVSKVGVVMNEEKEQEHKEMQELIINCLHKYFKGKAPGLKEVANQGISFAEKRRQDRNAQSIDHHQGRSRNFSTCGRAPGAAARTEMLGTGPPRTLESDSIIIILQRQT